MFARRGDKFCAATTYDSGPTSPALLPAGNKSALIVYNLGCELPPGVALTVLLNGVVVWPSVKSMSRGEPLQFASGLYSYDAFATTSDMSAVSMPGILESGSGGKRSLEFRPHTLYRVYFARIQGSATALMEVAANDTLKLAADLERDDAVVKSFDPQKWLIDNSILAGAIGGAILCNNEKRKIANKITISHKQCCVAYSYLSLSCLVRVLDEEDAMITIFKKQTLCT